MLVADPVIFERASFLAESVAGAHWEAAYSGLTPMDHGAIHSNGNVSSNNPSISGGMASNYRCTQGTKGNH